MQFNNLELGAILTARARQMMDNDLLFGATFDGHSDLEIREDLQRILQAYYEDSVAKELVDALMALTEEELLKKVAE